MTSDRVVEARDLIRRALNQTDFCKQDCLVALAIVAVECLYDTTADRQDFVDLINYLWGLVCVQETIGTLINAEK